MKLLIITLTIVCGFSINAQVQTNSDTKHRLDKLETLIETGDLSKEWIASKLSEYPIYKVNDVYCLSMLASVSASFTEADLLGKAMIGSQTGNVVTLKVPLTTVADINQFKGIEYLEIAERIQPDNHKMTADVRADSVWQGINLMQSYTGKNVLIGITDWGFDYEHPMFMDTTLTTSRVRAAWDQFKIDGDLPAGMTYGVEYDTPTELSNAHSDTAGAYYDYATHGSHVAGIAAGSGAGLIYRGVAFESEYLFTSLQLDAASAIDAFNWMKSIADADGKRLVINMSWGLYYMGTMDGTSLVSQAIDNLSAAGVVFVTSAGNNGDVNLHIKKDFNNDSIRSKITFYGYSLHPFMWGECITMWGEPLKPFGAQLEVYNSSNVLVDATPVYNTDLHTGYYDSIMVIGVDTVFYNYTVDSSYPLNSRPHIQLRVKNTNTSLRVVLSSFAPTGTVHYWNVVELSNGVGNWGQAFTSFGTNGVGGDTQYSVGEPACTESAITVAAHIAEVISQSGIQFPGNIAGFSSEGPTYDERIKPDVSAPGSGVISSINSYTTASYSVSATTTFNGRTYHFSAFSGTSMSSPAAAGVVALMLEANPNLSTAQVKDILKQTARQDSKTGTIPTGGSTVWGAGKVTANAACYLAENTVGISDPQEKENYLMVFPNPATDYLHLLLKNPTTKPISYQILSLEGKLVQSGSLSQSKDLDISQWERGMYLVRILDETTTTLKFIKE